MLVWRSKAEEELMSQQLEAWSRNTAYYLSEKQRNGKTTYTQAEMWQLIMCMWNSSEEEGENRNEGEKAMKCERSDCNIGLWRGELEERRGNGLQLSASLAYSEILMKAQPTCNNVNEMTNVEIENVSVSALLKKRRKERKISLVKNGRNWAMYEERTQQIFEISCASLHSEANVKEINAIWSMWSYVSIFNAWRSIS